MVVTTIKLHILNSEIQFFLLLLSTHMSIKNTHSSSIFTHKKTCTQSTYDFSFLILSSCFLIEFAAVVVCWNFLSVLDGKFMKYKCATQEGGELEI